MPFAENLDDFLSVEELATSALYDGSVELRVIFDRPYVEAPLSLVGIGGVQPEVWCKSADVAADPAGKTLLVDGVTYTIVRAESDGTGMSRLVLRA